MAAEGQDREENIVENGLEERRRELQEVLTYLLASSGLGGLRLILNDRHPSDLAEFFSGFNEAEQQQILVLPAPSLVAALLTELDRPTRRELAEDMPEAKLAVVSLLSYFTTALFLFDRVG